MKGGFILFLPQNRKRKAFLIFIGFEERKPSKVYILYPPRNKHPTEQQSTHYVFGRNDLLKQGISEVFNRYCTIRNTPPFPHGPSKYRNHRLKKQNEQEKDGSIPTTNSRQSQYNSFWRTLQCKGMYKEIVLPGDEGKVSSRGRDLHSAV